MAKKQLNVLVHSLEGMGHINACIGIAQALHARGHRIIFTSSPAFKGQFVKFGFEERILTNSQDLEKKSEDEGNSLKASLETIKKSGWLSNLSPLEKLKVFKDSQMVIGSRDHVISMEPQLAQVIKQEKPDLILIDQFLFSPTIYFGKIPWVYQFSGAPTVLFDSTDIPPPMSGLPSNDRTNWKEYRKALEDNYINNVAKHQSEINQHFGFPEMEKFPMSPYLNYYGYPEELDWTDKVPMPNNLARVDAFYRVLPEPFELPEEFKRKFRSCDRLFYLSLGSIGSMDVELMKRIVSVLKKSPHKFIVSRGPLWKEYELGENMWGESYLPQTSILPMVDAVITHGGNNTVTETVCCGKPMIVMPLFADQFDNAQRVHEKGFGVRLDAYNFTDKEMLDALDKVTSDLDIRQRVANAAIRIAMSNSKNKLVDKLEKLVEMY